MVDKAQKRGKGAYGYTENKADGLFGGAKRALQNRASNVNNQVKQAADAERPNTTGRNFVRTGEGNLIPRATAERRGREAAYRHGFTGKKKKR